MDDVPVWFSKILYKCTSTPRKSPNITNLKSLLRSTYRVQLKKKNWFFYTVSIALTVWHQSIGHKRWNKWTPCISEGVYFQTNVHKQYGLNFASSTCSWKDYTFFCCYILYIWLYQYLLNISKSMRIFFLCSYSFHFSWHTGVAFLIVILQKQDGWIGYSSKH